MARFHFSLRNMASHATGHAVVSQRTLRARHFDDAGAGDAPGPASQGPGWFESSWELIRGLDVREGLPGDARLNEWLEVLLRDEPAARPAATESDEQPGARLAPSPAHGALADPLQFGDLGFAAAAEVAHLDEFSEFGIDGLELA